MTTFLLIRHAAHTLAEGTLAGHLPGVGLSAAGEAQAARLADRLATLPIAAIYAGPLTRTQQTAAVLAARCGLPVLPVEGLTEIDFGTWTGKRFDDLAADPAWAAWNSFRSSAPTPSGELMVGVQARAVAALQAIARLHPDQTVVVVSHADVIKAVIAHYLGIPLDLFHRIAIDLASISVLALHPWGAQVIRLNDTGELPDPI